MSVLDGGVFPSAADDLTDLRNLVDDIGRRSFDSRIGRRSLPDTFDRTAWHHLEDTGLTCLASAADSGGGPTELAVVLRSLARHSVTVPLAETDLLGGWLASQAGVPVAPSEPLTVATGNANVADGRITATAATVPYAADAESVLFMLRDGERRLVAAVRTDELSIRKGHNAGGEPRDTVAVDRPTEDFIALDCAAETELTLRGAWARCVQTIGALDAAVEFSVAHTRERHQFGRPLSAFQTVQHILAGMAGEVERGRAATNLAVAAAADYGFHSPRTEYAVAVAKVALGRAVPTVVTAAHQLHGAIGVTIEHRLWLSTMRARSWIDEFGVTACYAMKLGRLTLAAEDPWDVVIGRSL